MVERSLQAMIRLCPRCGVVQPPANFCRNCGLPEPAPVPVGFVPRQRRGFLRASFYSCLTLVAAVLLLCVLASVFISPGATAGSIALAVAASLLPTIAYVGLVVWLDRNEPESWELRALTFFWGAVVAVFLALILNTTAFSIFALASGPEAGAILTAVISAPLVEESAKGLLVLLVLVVTRRHIDGMLDGLLLGALVGLGFAMTENIMYFGRAYGIGGVSSVGALFVIRSLINGLGHAVWTSFTGAAIGWSRDRHGRGMLRVIVPVLGWTAAVLGHAIWNLFASITIGILSIGFENVYLLDDWQAMILAGVIGGLPFSVPPLLFALLLVILGHDQEERVVREYLPIEVHLGTMTPAEYETMRSTSHRRQAVRAARQSGGKMRQRQVREFQELATRLAFFHYHAIRGERPYLPEIRRAEQARWQIAALRWSMLNKT